MPSCKSSRSHPESVLTSWNAWPESHRSLGKLAPMGFGGEGQGEGVCHDYHGLPAFETVSDARPTGLRISHRCSRHMESVKNHSQRV